MLPYLPARRFFVASHNGIVCFSCGTNSYVSRYIVTFAIGTVHSCKKIKKVLDQQFRKIYESGVHRFLIPGTLGVGIWAGELLLRMKEQTEYFELKLVVLPYASHDSGWDNHNKTRLSFLLCHAADKISLTKKGGGKDYRQTYLYMAEQCERLVAVCDEQPQPQEDVAQAVNCARMKDCALILIHPDNGKVLELPIS